MMVGGIGVMTLESPAGTDPSEVGGPNFSVWCTVTSFHSSSINVKGVYVGDTILCALVDAKRVSSMCC
jgi:hypothetical protein